MQVQSLFRRLLALWAVVLATALPAQAALFERSSGDLRADAKAATAAGKQLAVFLSLPDCAGCLEMERTVFRDARLEAAFARRFHGVRLDIADATEIIDPTGQSVAPAEFARRLRIVGTPSLAFFDGDGKPLYRHTGTLDAHGFGKLINYAAHAEYEQRPFTPPPRRRATGALFAAQLDATMPNRPEFLLQATDGRERNLADFRGQVVALAVGYTHCPDVCPTTLVELKAAVESLPARQRSQVQILFATLDPERDKLELLASYVGAFRPSAGRPMLGLRGDAEQTAALVRQLHLVAEKQASASMGYTLDHTAGIFLFDRRGTLVGFSPFGQPLTKLARDFATLVADPTDSKH
jgi:protein SCO1/2